MNAEDLFAAETKLRAAATRYAAARECAVSSPNNLNDARRALRAAAVHYAAMAKLCARGK